MNKTKPDKIKGKKAAILRRTAADIVAHSMRFNMGDWVDTSDEHAACQTTACIAGFICMNQQLPKSKSWRLAGLELDKKYYNNEFDFDREAIRIAGLTNSEAQKLFYSAHWPDEFKYDHRHFEDKVNSDSPYSRQMKAHIAAARIEHFIKTGE